MRSGDPVCRLSPAEWAITRQCWKEAGGGSTAAFAAVAGRPIEELQAFSDRVWDDPESIRTDADWRLLVDGLHAAIYALGPMELHACTGYTLPEVIDVALRVHEQVSGVFGGYRFSGEQGTSVP